MEHQKQRVRYSKSAGLAVVSAVLILAGMATGGQSPAAAVATAVDLGTATSFSVLGSSAVTNTGPSVISGDLGVSPESAITGFPPGIVLGTQHPDDAVAGQAQSDLTTAYNDAAGQASDAALPADLGGLTLVPGVYTASSSAGLTGTLTLDAQNDPDAVFVFQIGSTLTTASSSSVSLINGADPCNVFWQVGSSATLGTSTTFVGSIMALVSVTVTTGASIDGRALARTGAVTLDSNRITTPDCGDGGGGVDADGTDADGTDTEGTDTDGTAIEGTDIEGTDTDGTDTDGTDTEGTDTDGTDTEGTDTEGTDTDGTDTEGTDTDGTDTEGTDTDGTDTEGTDTDGTDTAGTATAGTGTDGTDAQGTSTDGTDTDTDGTDSDSDDSDSDSTKDDDDSSDRDIVPRGHPETGLGGTASNPYSYLLIVLGGLAGFGSLLVSARGFRRATRKPL